MAIEAQISRSAWQSVAGLKSRMNFNLSPLLKVSSTSPFILDIHKRCVAVTVLADAVTVKHAVSSGYLQVQGSPDNMGAVQPQKEVCSQAADTIFFSL